MLFHLIVHGCRHKRYQSFQSNETGSSFSDCGSSSQNQLPCLYDLFRGLSARNYESRLLKQQVCFITWAENQTKPFPTVTKTNSRLHFYAPYTTLYNSEMSTAIFYAQCMLRQGISISCALFMQAKKKPKKQKQNWFQYISGLK